MGEVNETMFDYNVNAEKDLYIKQLEEENARLKNSIGSLRNNNKGLLQGLNKVGNVLAEYRKRYGDLCEDD